MTYTTFRDLALIPVSTSFLKEVMDPLKDITGERVQTSMSLEGFEPAILMRYDLHIEYYLLVTV